MLADLPSFCISVIYICLAVKKGIDKRGLMWYNEYIKRRKEMITMKNIQKNLTNADLIAILSKRDPNAPADIFVDVRVWNTAFKYPDADMDSGICYSSDDDTIFLNFGQF